MKNKSDDEIKKMLKKKEEPIEPQDIYKTRIGLKRIGIIIGIVLVAALIVMGIGLYIIIKNKVYTSYEVVATTVRTDSSTTLYKKMGNHVMKYSRDGAAAIGKSGTLIWNESYEMKNPDADVCGNYAVIADINGNSIYIFGKNGKEAEIPTLLPIVEVKIASQGVVCVVLEDAESNYIEMYSKDGTKLVEKKTIKQRNGFPIDIAISDDGKKLVTSYMAVQNGIVKNYLTFYNFDEVGQNQVDSIVGAFNFDNSIVAKVDFLNNDTVCAYADNKFVIYEMKQFPKEIYTEEYTDEVRSIFSSEDNIGFVYSNQEGEEKYIMKLYNLNGKNVLSKKFSFDYNNIYLTANKIIIYNELECIIYDINGIEKFQYNFGKSISYIFPLREYYRFIVIDDVLMEEIKLD